MEINIDEFFEILLDHVPQYIESDDEYYDDADKWHMIFIIEYKEFKSPNDYYIDIQNRSRKILMHFRREHAKNNINDQYVEGYLEELYFEKNNFVMRNMNGKEYLCHENAYCTASYDLDDKKKPLEELNTDWMIESIRLYNEYRYDIINYLISGFEKILKKPAVENSNSEKLDLNVTIGDIALLFRLLNENKVFLAKHNTHIYRLINNSFKISGRDSFNEGSIKNAYNDPDPNSVKNLEILLANMKASLKKI